MKCWNAGLNHFYFLQRKIFRGESVNRHRARLFQQQTKLAAGRRSGNFAAHHGDIRTDAARHHHGGEKQQKQKGNNAFQGAFQGKDSFPKQGENGIWLFFSRA